MKRLLFTLLSLLVVTGLSARHISESEALSKARQFLPGVSLRAPAPSRSGDALKNLYVFDGTEGGFVIVSADDRTPAILGYSTNGRLDADNPPPGYLWLLGLYDQAIASLPAESRAASTPSRADDSDDWPEIAPLIQTQWGQDDPYNQFCPTTADGTRCLTGCVATAMAQVINYHRWPQEVVKAIPGYTSRRIPVSDLPERRFDWDNMSQEEIATLMLYCGASVKMDYSTTESGAYFSYITDALSTYFYYGGSTSLVSRDDFSDEMWLKLAYSELSQGNPLLYSGKNSSGGHAFVVDGYSDGMFHVNWGWNGNCDGYFSLDNLNPISEDGYNRGQSMIINALAKEQSKIKLTGFSGHEGIFHRISVDNPFPGTSFSWFLESSLTEELTLEIGWAISNDKGIVDVPSYKSYTILPGEYYTDTQMVNFPINIPDGEYRITAVSRINESDEWTTISNWMYYLLKIEQTSMGLCQRWMSEDDLDFGNQIIDGTVFHLYKGAGFEAKVLWPESIDNDSWKLNIPQFVSYQGKQFRVYNGGLLSEYTHFDSVDNSRLSSISTHIALDLSNCPNLSELVFPESCNKTGSIQKCPKLKELVFPKYCREIGLIDECDSITSLTFLCKEKISIKQKWDETLWSKESLPLLTDVYFSGDIPPVFSDEYPSVVPNKDIRIHIPEGSADTYRLRGWDGWTLVEDQKAIPVSVSWDYCGKCEYNEYGRFEDSGIGSCFGDYTEFAMHIPSDHISPYKGCKITAIEYHTVPIGSWDYGYENVEYVFITTPGVDYLAKQSANTIRGEWTRVELSDPYTITGDELFVGIGKHDILAASWANLDIEEDAFWIRGMGGELHGIWNSNRESYNHPLPLRAIIEGDQLPTDIVIVNSEITRNNDNPQRISRSVQPDASTVYSTSADPGHRSKYASYSIDYKDVLNIPDTKVSNPVSKSRADDSDKVRLKIRNRSPHLVKDIKFDISVNGVTLGSETIHTALVNNENEIVYIDLSDISGRTLDLEFNVSDIDGRPDEISANSIENVYYSASTTTHFPRKIVFEEIGGTWCAPCVNGIAAIEWMNKLYPDNFIALSLHTGDEMTPTDGSCNPYFSAGLGVPYARINRGRWQGFSLDIDNLIGIDDLFDFGEASISADATFKDKKIIITTETIFGFDDNGDDKYRIAYVLLEDKVGPYIQNNVQFSNPDLPDDPDHYLNWWAHQGRTVKTTYDNVVRTIHDYDGIKGQLPDKITEGETYKSSYTMEIPSNVDDAANLRVVTLLLDNVTGEILNADQTTISGTPPVSGIPEVITDAADDTFDIYNLSGIRVRTDARTTAGLPSGLYILSTPTSTRKIVIP